MLRLGCIWRCPTFVSLEDSIERTHSLVSIGGVNVPPVLEECVILFGALLPPPRGMRSALTPPSAVLFQDRRSPDFRVTINHAQKIWRKHKESSRQRKSPSPLSLHHDQKLTSVESRRK